MKWILLGLRLAYVVALALLSLLFVPLGVQAQELCQSLNQAQDIIECIKTRHPEVQLSQAELDIAESSKTIARQRPNPELDSRILGGYHTEEFLSEINFRHTVELGGKRQSRIDQANARVRVSSWDIKSFQERVILESTLALYRLRQIPSEKAILTESLSSLSHIQSLYQKRPLLDAEQQASQSVFQLVKKDIQLDQMELVEEELQLKALVEKAAGQTIAWKPDLLPKSPKSWPQVSQLQQGLSSSNIAIQKAESELDYAKTSLKLAKSEAKPDLKIGPSIDTKVEHQEAKTETGLGLGVNLSIPLPIYHQNQGQKQQAMLQQKKAQLNLELTQRQKALEAEQLLKIYSSLVKSLKASQSLSAGTQHQDIEALFERGFISSTLIVETHRQLIESKQKYHELELKALEALWRLYALQGRIFEVKL